MANRRSLASAFGLAFGVAAGMSGAVLAKLNSRDRTIPAAAVPPPEWSQEDARRLVEIASLRRVSSRVLGLLGAGSYVAGLYLTVRTLLSMGEPFTVSAKSLADASVPLSQSADTVLPALTAVVVALAVIKAVGAASSFIVGIATMCGWLAVTWASLAVVATWGTDPLAEGRAFGGAALATVCVAVGAVVREVLPLSEAARRSDDRLRATQLATRLERLLAAERMTRRYNAPYSHLARVWLGVACWYILAGLMPVLILATSDAAAGGQFAATAQAVWTLIPFGLLSVAGLHIAVVVRFWASSWKWILFGILVSASAALVGAAPLLLVRLSMQRGQPMLWLVAMLEAGWALLVLASALVPLIVALPRLALFGQLTVAGMTLSAQAAERRREELKAAEDRLRGNEEAKA